MWEILVAPANNTVNLQFCYFKHSESVKKIIV